MRIRLQTVTLTPGLYYYYLFKSFGNYIANKETMFKYHNHLSTGHFLLKKIKIYCTTTTLNENYTFTGVT